jgi:acyl carrier protein
VRNIDEVRAWILAWVERELQVSAKEIATDASLLNYGMDSVNAIMLIGDLESELNLRLPPRCSGIIQRLTHWLTSWFQMECRRPNLSKQVIQRLGSARNLAR